MEYQQYIDSNGNIVRIPVTNRTYPALSVSYLASKGYGHVTGYTFTNDIPAFRAIIEKMPQHFRMVELGSLHGASAITISLLAREMGKTCDILCIDYFGLPNQLETFIQNTMDFSNITYRAELFDSSFQYDGGPIDLYFDDASHEEIPTYTQLVYWSQYAKNIAVHDYISTFKGNIAAVDKFASERALQVETFTHSSVVLMENV
jgi:hypothetical protein